MQNDVRAAEEVAGVVEDAAQGVATTLGHADTELVEALSAGDPLAELARVGILIAEVVKQAGKRGK